MKSNDTQLKILRNGVTIPTIGLGTWCIPNEEAENIVKEAILLGYKHIDTAQAYCNEEGVGKGVIASGVDRKKIFITSKVEASFKTYNEAATSINESLKRLNTDYIDLMLIHCPQPWDEFTKLGKYDMQNLEVWRALEDAYLAKKVRAIGVSNFNIHDIQNIMSNCRIKPMVNQILVHIGFTPTHLIRWCKRNHIVVEAYSPLAHGEIKDDIRVNDISKLKRVSAEKLAIGYTLKLGLVTLPKATGKIHLAQNLKSHIKISENDMLLLEGFEGFYKNDHNMECVADYYNLIK